MVYNDNFRNPLLFRVTLNVYFNRAKTQAKNLDYHISVFVFAHPVGVDAPVSQNVVLFNTLNVGLPDPSPEIDTFHYIYFTNNVQGKII